MFDVKPVIGYKLIDDITSPDILKIVKNIEARGANEMARRIMAEVGQIFKHAIKTGLATYNPASDLFAAIKPHKTKNHSRISSKELPKLSSDIDNYTGHITVKLGLWFLCYTFVRTNELRFMEWAEIDWNDNTWRIPADKMKMDKPHIAPLAPQVIDILQQIKELNFSEQYVFYNPSTRKPYSQNAFINVSYA